MIRNIFISLALLLPLADHAQTYSEILGRPTDKSITINAVFGNKCDVFFEYGFYPSAYTSVTDTVSVEANASVEKVLSGLSPNTRYYYRTRYRLSGTSAFLSGEDHSFMTQRTKGSKFVFTVEADPHPYDKKCYSSLWDIALNNQLNDGADFMIDLGDTFGDDHEAVGITSARVKELMLNERPHFGVACHSLPLFFCIGNHEGESGYYLQQTPPDNIAVYETLWRKQYYPNPYPDDFYSGNNDMENYGMDKPGNYYSWEWGDALFVVLDSWRYSTASVKPRGWEWTLGEKQYNWLKSVLENSNAKYKFVFCHHIMGECRGAVSVATSYEWGGLDNDKDEFSIERPGWEMPIHQLLQKNKVNILFQGHDHVFAYEKLNDVVYQTVPMPSDSSYTLGYIANASAFKGTTLTGTGHIRVTVCPDSVKVDFVNSRLPKDEESIKNRDVSYSYSVRPAASVGISTIEAVTGDTKLLCSSNGELIVTTSKRINRPCEIILNGIDGSEIICYKFATLDNGMKIHVGSGCYSSHPKLCIARLLIDGLTVSCLKMVLR